MHLFLFAFVGYFIGCLLPGLEFLRMFKNTKVNKKKQNILNASPFTVLFILFGFSLLLILLVEFLGTTFDSEVIKSTCGAWGEHCEYGEKESILAGIIIVISIIVNAIYMAISQIMLVRLLPKRRITFMALLHLQYGFLVVIALLQAVFYSGMFTTYEFDPIVEALKLVLSVVTLFGFPILKHFFNNKYEEWK
jgi:hypothetical protein